MALKNTIIQNELHHTFAMLQKLIVPIALLSFFLSACGSMPDKTAWDRVQGHLTADTLEWFLKEYPNSEYHKDASAKLEDIYWKEASYRNTVFFYLKYANRFPKGQYLDNAMRMVSELPKDAISLQELENGAFIGQLEVKGEEPHLLSLRFGKTVKDVETDTLQFVADLNIGDQKTELRGFIETFDNSVHFLQGDSLNRILYTNGKLYKRDGKLFMESTGTEQYWMLSN